MRKFLILFLLSLQVAAQEYSVKKGVVVDNLKVNDSLSESYALYLPTTFSNTRTWPVLFLFDPGGRGKSAAQLFKSIAEEQGYLVVSSNDISSENELVKNVEIAARLMSWTTRMLPTDFKQVNTVGTMDGAKVASSVPLIFGNIFGVVAAGDHYMNLDLLDRKSNFAFVGIVGDEQYTSTGINLTAAALDGQNHMSAVYTYNGASDWPKPDVLFSAVGSLTLQAMRQKLRPVDQQLVNTLYQKDMLKVDKMISSGEMVPAWHLLELMSEKYDGLRSLAEVEQKQSQLRRSRTFLEQKKKESEIMAREDRLKSDLLYYFREDVETANFENLGWWNYQKNKLDSLAQKSPSEAKMAKRVEGFVREMAETARQEYLKKNPDLNNELLANMILTIFNPHNYNAYKRIITLSSQDNDFATALFYFEEMLKNGYRDKEGVYDIEGTLALKMTPDFNWLVKKYIGEPRFYNE